MDTTNKAKWRLKFLNHDCEPVEASFEAVHMALTKEAQEMEYFCWVEYQNPGEDSPWVRSQLSLRTRVIRYLEASDLEFSLTGDYLTLALANHRQMEAVKIMFDHLNIDHIITVTGDPVLLYRLPKEGFQGA